jgi:hypothetical protein
MSTTLKLRLARLASTIVAAGALLVGATAHANNYRVHVHGTTVVPSRAGVYVPPSAPGPGYRPHYGYPGTVYPGARPYHYYPSRVWVHAPYYGYRTYYAYPYYGYPYAYGYGYDYGYRYGYAVPTAPAPMPPPVATVYGAPPPPPEPVVGIGIRGSAIHSGHDHPDAQGLGALLRFRARPVELELEVGWDGYGPAIDRNDTRVATSLYVPIVGRVIVPYLVVGAGMNFANFGSTGDTLHQGFAAGGGGLAVNFSPAFGISADVRYMVRHFFDNADIVAYNLALDHTPTAVYVAPPNNNRDEAVEFRANAVVYF